MGTDKNNKATPSLSEGEEIKCRHCSTYLILSPLLVIAGHVNTIEWLSLIYFAMAVFCGFLALSEDNQK